MSMSCVDKPYGCRNNKQVSKTGNDRDIAFDVSSIRGLITKVRLEGSSISLVYFTIGGLIYLKC